MHVNDANVVLRCVELCYELCWIELCCVESSCVELCVVRMCMRMCTCCGYLYVASVCVYFSSNLASGDARARAGSAIRILD